MNALLKKEARLLLVPWGAALGLTLAPALLGAVFPALRPQVKALALLGFAAGTVSLSLASIGREITSHTFSSLLALPLQRHVIWRTKFTISIAAVASICAALLITVWASPAADDHRIDHDVLIVLSLAAAALATGLLTTILLRQVAAAMCFTILLPALMTAVGAGISRRVAALSSPESQVSFICMVLALYAVTAFYFARALFLRAEDVPWTGGVIEIPSRARHRKRASLQISAPAHAPFSALIRKELRLQRFTFVMAVGVGLLHIIVFAARWNGAFDKLPPDSSVFIIFDAVPFLWLFVALLGGTTAVADERRTGVIEAQLCLPVGAGKQFIVKAGVVFGIALVFGFGFPLLFEQFSLRRDQNLDIGDAAGLWMFGSFSTALLGFLASSLTRGLSEALSAAVGLGVALMLGFTLMVSPPYVGGNSYLWPPLLVMWVAPAVLFIVGLVLAARNWRLVHITTRDWLVTISSLAAAWVSVLGVASFAYFRPWEFLTPLETPHEAARFTATAPPTLAAGYWWLSAVMPDGRLWVNKRTELEPLAFLPQGIRERVTRSQDDAAFLDGSDWRESATTFRHCAGLKKDGTLWEIQLPAAGERFAVNRIGDGTNWVSITADNTHFLALRSDGTLWSWGSTWGGQLGVGHVESEITQGRLGGRKRRVDEINTPTQVGGDSGWAAAWALGGASLALKTNGNSWVWGSAATNIFHITSDPYIPQPCPVHVLPPLAVSGNSGMRAWVHTDGTLWIEGSQVPPSIFGLPESWTIKTNTPFTQLGKDRQWKDAAVGHEALAALATDGTLWKWQRVWPRSGQSYYEFRQVGKHTDWLAIRQFGSGFVSMAADGSLWCWNERNFNGWIDFTGARRKPLKIATLK